VADARRRALVELLWRAPFVLASAVMVGAGVAHALGRPAVPAMAALVALALASVGCVAGLITLRARPLPADPTPKDPS
jgi:hypothetical protein